MFYFQKNNKLCILFANYFRKIFRILFSNILQNVCLPSKNIQKGANFINYLQYFSKFVNKL